MFDKIIGMRIDHVLVTTSLRHRVVWAEIDREARKGKPDSQITHRWSSTSTARHSLQCRPAFGGIASCGALVEANRGEMTPEECPLFCTRGNL
jgi:hypothetical protein